MKKSRDDYLTILLIAVTAIYMLIALAFPMYAILSKGLQNKDGKFIGFENYINYFESPALVYSIYNSFVCSYHYNFYYCYTGLCICLCSDTKLHDRQNGISLYCNDTYFTAFSSCWYCLGIFIWKSRNYKRIAFWI